jgi:hypothetical protein
MHTGESDVKEGFVFPVFDTDGFGFIVLVAF